MIGDIKRDRPIYLLWIVALIPLVVAIVTLRLFGLRSETLEEMLNEACEIIG